MAKQIRPQQITERVAQIVATQQERGYKTGWVYHQMDKKVEKMWKHLCHAYDARSIPSHACEVAKGNITIDDLIELYSDNWEIYNEECETFGLPENER